MKLAIDRNELERGLGRLQAFVGKRRSMPILANVLLTAQGKDALQLAAASFESGLRGTYGVGLRVTHAAEVAEPGSLTVSARVLYDIVRELPNQTVRLTGRSNSYLELRCGSARFSLAGTQGDEYPSLPECAPGKLVRLQAAVLAQIIERTLYAASQDQANSIAKGVYFEVLPDTGKLRMVATDGHRLALVDRTAGSDTAGLASGVIIPRTGLAELKRLLDEEGADEVELGFAGNSALAQTGGVTLVMDLIEEPFPNYQAVIPKRSEMIRLTLPTGPLASA